MKLETNRIQVCRNSSMKETENCLPEFIKFLQKDSSYTFLKSYFINLWKMTWLKNLFDTFKLFLNIYKSSYFFENEPKDMCHINNEWWEAGEHIRVLED